MKVSIRLYRRHDMDLIAIHKNPNANFHKMVMTALSCYANHTPYLVSAPEPDKDKKDYKVIYQLFLNFDEKKDAKVIKLLQGVKPKYRTAFIKSVIRGCIVGVVTYGTMEDETDAKKTDVDINKAIPESVQEFPRYSSKKVKNVEKSQKKHKIKSEKQNVKPAKPAKPIKQSKPKENQQDLTKAPEMELNHNNNPQSTMDFSGFGDLSGFGDFSTQPVKDTSDDFDLFGDLNKMLNNF